MRRKPPDRRAAAKRAALKALKRVRRAAADAGTTLSDWEDEFLGSVADRVARFGAAFADPDKGAPGAALSALQGAKLKEIAGKAAGKPRRGLRRRKSAADEQN